MTALQIELPEGFLEEENRCGYTVSKDIKQLWAVELDIFAEFIRVCNEHDLRFFVSYGTLLGAVRHNGFIPWDDDIDVLMPSADYDRLLEIGPAAFKAPYFFQTTATEEYYWRSHIQIRNSETTGFIPQDARKVMNKGIFVDITPLEKVPDSVLARRFHRLRLKFFDSMGKGAVLAHYHDIKRKGLMERILQYPCVLVVGCIGLQRLFSSYNKARSAWRDRKCSTVAHVTVNYSEADDIWPEACFEETVYLPFENLRVPVPGDYDTVLRRMYGDDYMEIPAAPPKPTHGSIIFDAETPYIKYFETMNDDRI